MGLDLFTREIEETIENKIILPLGDADFRRACYVVGELQALLYANIPDDKRISYGRYYTIKTLSAYLNQQLENEGLPVFEFATYLFENSLYPTEKGVALGMLSYCGETDLQAVIPYFLEAASRQEWEVRENAQAFARRLIKAHPQQMKELYLQLVHSEDRFIRRFVSESLRPVSENRWFQKDPQYPLSILRHLFYEHAAYPRTSVGNNLSDWARKEPEMVYDIVAELAASGNKDAFWIAKRACRNLVKKDPLRVMDLLGVDQYKYKKRIHRREDIVKNADDLAPGSSGTDPSENKPGAVGVD